MESHVRDRNGHNWLWRFFRHLSLVMTLVSESSVAMDVLNGPCKPLNPLLSDIAELLDRFGLNIFLLKFSLLNRKWFFFGCCFVIFYTMVWHTYGDDVQNSDDVDVAFCIESTCVLFQVTSEILIAREQ